MGKPRSPWGKGTTLAIIIFVSLFVIIGSIYSNKAKSDEKSETFIHLTGGATFVGGQQYESEALLIVENLSDKYEVGILLQLRLDCIDVDDCRRGESESANQAIFAQRVVRIKDFQMGIGFSYWHNQSPGYNTHTPFVLSSRYDITKDISLNYWHFSSGGSSSSNGGLDFISVAYKF